jgi:hypothetical protein
LRGIGGFALVSMTTKSLVAALMMGVTLFVVATLLAPVIDGHRLLPVFHWQAPYIPFTQSDGVAQHLRMTHIVRLHLAAQVGISIAAGCLVYAGVLWALRVDEMKLVTDRFAAKLRRRAAAV